MTERLYSVADLADCLGVCTATIYRLIKRQLLASVRVGATVRIPASSVDRYLQQTATAQLAAAPPRPRLRRALTTQDPAQLCDWSEFERLDERMARRKGLANV